MVQFVKMRCDLTRCNIGAAEIPAEISIVAIATVPVEEVYQCYHAAFDAGDAQFFFEQTPQQRRAFFDTLGLEQASSEPASVALIHATRVIGFSLVLAYGEPANRHISCMCIDPAFQGRGLGRQLLWVIMHRVKASGGCSITLGTEPGMRAFALYQSAGFAIIA